LYALLSILCVYLSARLPVLSLCDGRYDVFSNTHLEAFFQLNDTAKGATAPQWLWIVPGGHCTASAIGWPRFALIPPELQGAILRTSGSSAGINSRYQISLLSDE
jgi:hypothetical protein